MLSQIIKLWIIFIIFAVIMVAMVRDKKVKYGWVILGVFLPVAVYILCEAFETMVLRFLCGGSVMAMAIWDATEGIICSLSCVIAGIIIFKTITKSKDSIFGIFRKDYKKWNIVVVVFIVLGAIICIVEGIDYTIHEKEYKEIIVNMIMNTGILDLVSGEIMPGNMKLFAILKKITRVAMLAGILLPSVIMTRKTEKENNN